jgi:hypothetical protein|tara:strand:- start:81 stop:293 length:213 start_codon:yes stop_codon:yes gene_type:complete
VDILAWKDSGFSIDNTVGVAAKKPQGGRRQLAHYIIRNPFSLKKITRSELISWLEINTNGVSDEILPGKL